MFLRRWGVVVDPVSGVTSAQAAMPVAPDPVRLATMRAVVVALVIVLRTKSVAPVWGMLLSVPSAKPWSMHSKP